MIGFPSCLASVLYAIYVFSLPNISHWYLVPSELDPLLVKRHNFKVLYAAMSQSNWQSSGQKKMAFGIGVVPM